ncbi:MULTISPECIES: IS3 family transposase, partial [unclassified Marinobacterium]
NYIELFYNSSRRHGNNNGMSPVQYEEQYLRKLAAV